MIKVAIIMLGVLVLSLFVLAEPDQRRYTVVGEITSKYQDSSGDYHFVHCDTTGICRDISNVPIYTYDEVNVGDTNIVVTIRSDFFQTVNTYRYMGSLGIDKYR
jgi:hypothetical protein